MMEPAFDASGRGRVGSRVAQATRRSIGPIAPVAGPLSPRRLLEMDKQAWPGSSRSSSPCRGLTPWRSWTPRRWMSLDPGPPARLLHRSPSRRMDHPGALKLEQRQVFAEHPVWVSEQWEEALSLGCQPPGSHGRRPGRSEVVGQVPSLRPGVGPGRSRRSVPASSSALADGKMKGVGHACSRAYPQNFPPAPSP